MKKVCLSILISFFFINISCKKNSESSEIGKQGDNIVVDLHKVPRNEYHIDEIYNEFPVSTLKNKYPGYYASLLENMEGIPELDSFLIVTRNFELRPFIYELYKDGHISKEELHQGFQGDLKDTLNHLNGKNFQVHAVSGFRNDKQVIIFDTNRNYDFSDEKIYEFERDVRLQPGNSPEKLATSPIIELEYQISKGNLKYPLKRMMQIYPQVGHIHYYLFDDGNIDDLSNNYTLFMRIKDSRQGNVRIDEFDYNVALQNLYLSQLIIKPDSIEFEEGNIYFQKNFEYRIKDSLQLGNHVFTIDSVSRDISKLYLNKLESGNGPIYGNRMGEIIGNHTLLNLEEEELELFQILNSEKQYTFIDFWGTWCLPCIKLIPDLKDLHQEYSGKINFISIAYDDDINKVKSFTEENEMSWDHFFVNRANRRGTIITGLEISTYPTFILLDENNKIIYRGSSGSFEAISRILKEKT